MKKTIMGIIIIVAMLISLAACGKTQPAISSDISSVGNKFYNHMANGDYQKAIDLYFEKMAGNSVTENEAWEICDAYFSIAIENYANGTWTQDEASLELNKAKQVADGCSLPYDNEYEQIFSEISYSKNQYKLGISAFNSSNFVVAINYFQEVKMIDSNYEDAQIKITVSKEKIKTSVLADAQAYFDEGNHITAIELLQDSLNVLGDDVDIRIKIDDYTAKYKQKIKTSTLANAQQCFDEGNITDAIQILQNPPAIISNDIDIQTNLDKYTSLYVDNITNEANEVFNVPSEDWEKALQIIKSAQQIIPDNDILNQEEILYNQFRPVALTQLDYYDYDDNGSLNVAASCKDTLGNVHNNVLYASFSSTESSIFDIGKKYNVLTGTYAIDIDSKGSTFTGYIKIYGDGVLLWESGDLDSQTKPNTLSVDVTGVTDLKVQICSNGTLFWTSSDSLSPILSATLQRTIA